MDWGQNVPKKSGGSYPNECQDALLEPFLAGVPDSLGAHVRHAIEKLELRYKRLCTILTVSMESIHSDTCKTSR